MLVAGGFGASGNALFSSELYDPAVGAWSPTGDVQGAREEHTATLLPDGRVLAVGGAARATCLQPNCSIDAETTGAASRSGDRLAVTLIRMAFGL